MDVSSATMLICGLVFGVSCIFGFAAGVVVFYSLFALSMEKSYRNAQGVALQMFPIGLIDPGRLNEAGLATRRRLLRAARTFCVSAVLAIASGYFVDGSGKRYFEYSNAAQSNKSLEPGA